MRCIFGARFSMTAEVLRYSTDAPTNPNTGDPTPGDWTNNQDPITGEIITDWVPGTKDDATTVDVDEEVAHIIVPCMVQGLYNAGIRTSGSDETFGDVYYNTEYLKMWIPGNVVLTKRDRITNIRDSQGRLVFQDEEYDPDRSTVYNVQGVTPRFDYRNALLDQFLLLERAQ